MHYYHPIDDTGSSSCPSSAVMSLPQHESVFLEENRGQVRPHNTIRRSVAAVVSTFVACAACSSSVVTAMSTQVFQSNPSSKVGSTAFVDRSTAGVSGFSFSDDRVSDKSFHADIRSTTSLLRPHSWTDSVLLDDEEEEWDEELLDFQELQSASGSDVLNEELQRQIDASLERPSVFLDVLVQDASMMEKVAMSSVPQQLPRSAMTALQHGAEKSTDGKKRKSQIRDLDFAQTGRVTPEQEVGLAKLIQKGVALHKIKTDLESEKEREITRTEWTTSAKISVKELRQTVSDYRRAKQLLVSANMGLVHAVVKGLRAAKNNNVVSYEEMVQEGSLGLLRASELFDPSRGLRFSTYATIWIKGMLSNSHSAEPITLPQREKTKWNKIRRSHDDFVQEHDREPTPSELSELLGMNMEEFLSTTRKMTQAQQVLSLDYEYQTASRGGSETSSMASLQNDKAFMADVDVAERTQLHADVVAALTRNLDAREARLMRLRYGLIDGRTRTIGECAEAMGLSQTRTQQIAQQCLKKLRQAADMESLQEYLLTIA